MLEREPTYIVYDLLKTEWNAANTPIPDDPEIHTGWFEDTKPVPQVTVTNPEEGADAGGVTGHSASTGTGGVAQHRSGTMLVNCWAGSYEDLQNAGPSGEAVSPKKLAYDMAREVHRIMQENASGTSDPDGNIELLSLGADNARKIVEDTADPTVFRYEVTVRFTYATISP